MRVVGPAIAIAAGCTAHMGAQDRRPFGMIERGVIVRQSERPRFGSGIDAVWVAFDVEVPGGARQTMYLLYSGEDQFIPPVNSVCRIVFDRGYIEGLSSRGSLDQREARNVVDELACDSGTSVIAR